MLLAAALKNPELAASAVNAANAPGAVDVVRMFVAVMAEGSSVRSAVIAKNTTIRYAKNCSLEDWVSP